MFACKTDVPVLLIFFNRPETFSKVFEQVKLARPSKLFLYQDGARANRPGDLERVAQCRAIAEDIDWECEVHRLYQKENKGCDPSMFLAITWAFSHVDRCIIIEDDVVPSPSFFPFCQELLEKYKDDQRINMICGMNVPGVSENVTSDYLFSRCSSIWGWATWKRVVDGWDGRYTFLDDQESMALLKDNLDHNYHVTFDSLYNYAAKHRKSGREHFESILAFDRNLNNRLNIVPKYNLTCNIGVQEDSTHNVGDIRLLPKRVQQVFNMKTYPLEMPLKHPKYVIENYEHARRHMRILGIRHPFIKFLRGIDVRFRAIWFGKLFKKK